MEESSSYLLLEGFDNSPAQPCSRSATHPWEEQLAWNTEFDEPGSDDNLLARVVSEILPEEDEEEEEEAIDWGDATEVLAPFWLRKPQIEPVFGGEPFSGDVVSRPVAKEGNR